MDKQTFENVKTFLTTHRYYANDTDYSLNIEAITFYDETYYRIDVYPNEKYGYIRLMFASFFIDVAKIAGCGCSFRSVNNACVCRFY